jgi:hypothetical protein
VVVRTAERSTPSRIAAVRKRGLMRFMLHGGALNAAVDRRRGPPIAFLRRLGKDAGQTMFLIVANLEARPAAKVKT